MSLWRTDYTLTSLLQLISFLKQIVSPLRTAQAQAKLRLVLATFGESVKMSSVDVPRPRAIEQLVSIYIQRLYSVDLATSEERYSRW